MGSLLAELAASDTSLVMDDLFWEIGVFQSPETQKTRFQLAVVSAVNIELSITDDD